MANPNPSKPFKKGDPRINRSGRPKDFNGFRELAQEIAHEKITEVNGHGATVAEMILRKWASSNNPQLQRAFIEVAFGKVPDNLNLNGDLLQRVLIEYVNAPYPTADVSPGTGEDTSETEEV